MLLINYFYDGQSNPAIRGVVPADSVPCEQAVFGSREWVLTRSAAARRTCAARC